MPTVLSLNQAKAAAPPPACFCPVTSPLVSEEETNEQPVLPSEASLGRRRMLLGLGFGAANLALLRRLGTRNPTPAAPTNQLVTGSTTSTTSTTSLASLATSPPILNAASMVDPVNHVFDTVITAGRVIDPASGFDALVDIGIDQGIITYLGNETLTGRDTLDARNLVVSPGFIDLLSYPPNGYGEWFKIADGVTSNLCLHGIDDPMVDFLEKAATQDPPLNYGGATDQYEHRKITGANIDYLRDVDDVSLQDLTKRAALDLEAGALGIHEQPEYVPGVTFEEMLGHGAVAAQYGVPLCLHIRTGETSDPDLQKAAVTEAIEVARQAGCAVHIEHLNSTGGTGRMAEAIAQIEAARLEGLAITACTYPYTFWATYAGTPRFDNFQDKFGITYNDLQVAGTTKRVTESEWPSIRQQGLLTAAFAMSEQDITTALKAPWMMIGSDAILGPLHNNHPRSAGCFSRILGVYVREQSVLSLIDALARMTIYPAQLLETASPDLAQRGRLQGGAIADITIFDPTTIIDNADLENPGQESTGVHHVIVNGQIVRRNQKNDKTKRPGVPLLRGET